MDVLTIKGLKKSFGDKKILQGLDLSIPEHSIFGFVGRNGAGKTTTMKAVLGLLDVDGGEIYVCGEKVKYGQTLTNRHIGYLPDVPEFYSFMTAPEYLKLCGESLGLNSTEIKARSEELLSLVGLADEKHRIKGFSRGMKQRLGIAQALLTNPKLLICDEPTSALDPIGRKEILDVILSVKDKTTVLFSTHILADVERICTDIAILNEGKVAVQGSVEQLKHNPDSDGFTVEMLDNGETEILAEAFKDYCKCADGIIAFDNGEKMYEVLGFIKERSLKLSKIERLQPTLESLFVEVVNK